MELKPLELKKTLTPDVIKNMLERAKLITNAGLTAKEMAERLSIVGKGGMKIKDIDSDYLKNIYKKESI